MYTYKINFLHLEAAIKYYVIVRNILVIRVADIFNIIRIYIYTHIYVHIKIYLIIFISFAETIICDRARKVINRHHVFINTI